MTDARSAALKHPICALVAPAALAVLIAIAWRAVDEVLGVLDATRSTDVLSPGLIAAALLAYMALMMLPFCPGIEVGLMLILLGGSPLAPLVYLATVAALVLAFLIGRYVPQRTVVGLLGVLRLSRARELLLRIEPLETEQRLELLLASGRPRLLRRVLEHRHLALAIALNTPGNILVGDGGGIALAAGFSRLFSLPLFTLTVVVAVSPVPIALMLCAW